MPTNAQDVKHDGIVFYLSIECLQSFKYEIYKVKFCFVNFNYNEQYLLV